MPMPSIVGICPVCGDYVFAGPRRSKNKYCSWTCNRKAYAERLKLRRQNSCSLASIRVNRRQQLEEMRARLAARDEAYAKVAPKTTVEVVNGRRIETRGNKIIGVRAASF